MSGVLSADKSAAASEIAVYLKESVGNPTRIDYGTGNCVRVCRFMLVFYGGVSFTCLFLAYF